MENPVSRKQATALKKKEIKRAKDKDYYEKNRKKKIAQVIERRKARREETKGKSRTRTEIKKAASKKRRKEQRATAREELETKRQIAREKTRERNTGERFKNRTSKKRVTDKVKGKLPQTSEKKAEVLETLINSPRTRKILSRQGVVKTPEEEKETNTLKALASDISEGLKHVKRSGSNEKRAAHKALKSLAFGDNIKKPRAKKSLGKLVGLNEKSISKAIKTREEILKGEGESWLDALPEEDVEKIYCFWASSASRPTGDKSDFVKNRVGKNQYLTHPKHVLETSQTEAFQEFAKLHPEGKVAQRKFQMLKPYFVKQARERSLAMKEVFVGLGTSHEVRGQEKKKIALVPKETPPSEMFTYFKKLLEAYPLHSFMAKWQREQLDNLLEHLPLGHVVCIHDYSEGYACRQQDEIQSEFFDVAKASLHVTILHRHAVESKDGITSTEAEPHLIKEHLFVVSDDPAQDHDKLKQVQQTNCEEIEVLEALNEELKAYALALEEGDEKLCCSSKKISEVGTKQKSRKLKQLKERAQCALWFSKTFGLDIASIAFKDQSDDGKIYTLNYDEQEKNSDAGTAEPVLPVLPEQYQKSARGKTYMNEKSLRRK
ncbi:predicted protein [Nematostella vectensis]|uniref:Uncharacterized protein n=1 Tax=Nematostella vectensis TaxID=45351 RepID=A7T3A3_NEMVE|nr:predicted protein [Nematostella vectensis]|eukprot:XP_001621663.1 hypothetical protein NEMVEDRAFT_v1g221733 [Nematostella vectensis]